ncbi:glycosyltransferase family 4 protein [Acinetobacter bereziniae]|uniref:glycosyltransferase family 4 protein n=1 Tax=Acinetobacter bereziniae TaxID=106648 RepID=UPI0022EAC39D|nr:glycosyltransferase family 4 protein [Acinetobacter bereziniae]MDA3439428.1 glycosyltransferase family 4 protein [Acinetobacter bereziniae]
MNILLYNFVQFDEAGSPGGGVTVYLRNLVNELINQGHRVIFLSSGDRYDFFNKEPYLKTYHDDNLLTRCIIYNSPFVAPSASSFHKPDIFTSNDELDFLAEELFYNIPNIDVFHFHNIEGLTSSFIKKLKDKYNSSKFIYTVHNYNLLCMQVNLWYKDSENCLDYSLGRNCINCVGYNDISSHEKKVKILYSILKKAISDEFFFGKLIYGVSRKIYKKYRIFFNNKNHTPVSDVNRINENSLKFINFRRNNFDLCSNVFDNIICVSERTKEVLLNFGFENKKITVEYIGTKFYSNFKDTKLKCEFNDKMCIGYLGYMRADKGFDFFINALDKMPEILANKLEVVIAAKFRDEVTVKKIESLKSKFNKIHLYDGYNHVNIYEIMNLIDLGIIPVQWEDNLPQVAIEFVANGIPILVSNLGGPSEIFNKDNKFIFHHNDEKEFYRKLDYLCFDTHNLSKFWDNKINIFSIKSHLDKLLKLYYIK